MGIALSDPVLLGQIGAAHGVRGEVRVKAYTAESQAIGDYGPLSDADGRSYVVASLRPLKSDLLVVRFKGIEDRTAAEKLNRTKLYVPRAALPKPAEEEFYHADLIGLKVLTAAGDLIGQIAAVPNFGAGDLLEVARPGKASVYVPFTRGVVPLVDIAERSVTITPPDGLLDEVSESAEPPLAAGEEA